MPNSPSNNGLSQIEEIIDGVNDAKIPLEERQALLERIQTEGGVVSDQLTEDLIKLFDEQAEMERITREDNEALLQKLEQETATSGPEDQTDARQVVADVMAEQEKIATQVEARILEMRGDVTQMDKSLSDKAEGDQRTGEQGEIDSLKDWLRKKEE